MGKDVKSSSLRDLFIRPVRAERRVKRDTEAFFRAKRARAEIEAHAAAAQRELEIADGASMMATLKTAGVSMEQLEKSLSDARAARKALREKLGSAYPNLGAFAEAESVPVARGVSEDCTDITIHLCKRQLCTRQITHIFLDGMAASAGTDGNFDLVGENGFTLSDDVEGSSSWSGLSYHRHAQTHEGEIVITGSFQLSSEAHVYRFGAGLEAMDGESNSAWARGTDPMGKPPSSGRAKAWKQLRVFYRLPPPEGEEGEMQQLEFVDSEEDKYVDTGTITSNVAPVSSIAPAANMFLVLAHDQSFPTNTEFFFEATIRYWIHANGEGGEAGISFGVRPRLWIDMETCRYDYPAYLTIAVDDYL
jgi:hypothetical protein